MNKLLIIVFLLFFQQQFGYAQIDSLKFGLKGKIIRALANSPASPAVYYAGLKGKGFGTGLVYKSEDAGQSWSALNDGKAISPYTSDIQAIAEAQDAEKTIYAGTWKDGLYKSSDHGKTWRRDAACPSSDIRSIKTGIQNPLLVYAATSTFGVIKSADGGKTWTRNPPEQIESTFKFAWSVEIDQDNDSIVYAQTFSNGIWRSIDQGETWSKVLDTPDKVCWDMVVRNDGNELWVAASKRGDSLSVVYYSTDTGKNWKEIPNVPQIGVSQVNVIHQNGQRVLIIGSWDDGMYIYQNEVWTKQESVDFETISEILTNNKGLLIGSWGNGVYQLKL